MEYKTYELPIDDGQVLFGISLPYGEEHIADSGKWLTFANTVGDRVFAKKIFTKYDTLLDEELEEWTDEEKSQYELENPDD